MGSLPLGKSWQQACESDLIKVPNCLCPNCEGGNAETVFLPTKIPGFREIIVAGLTCPDCHFRNSEATFGGEIQTRGSTMELTLHSRQDLNRQIVKSDFCTITIPWLDLEVPPTTQKGIVTTTEGILSRIQEDLSRLQPERLKLGDIDNFRRCQRVMDMIAMILGGTGGEADNEIFPFAIIADDPSGNSFIENPNAPNEDPSLKVTFYKRTAEQDGALGLRTVTEGVPGGRAETIVPMQQYQSDEAIELGGVVRKEVVKLPTECSNCLQVGEMTSCVVSVPHFKEMVVMAMSCEHCGFRTREIKGGGAISTHGSRIYVHIEIPDDLNRDVIKSDTAGIAIPEIGLDMNEGGLGGAYTTVEGLLEKIYHQLELANPFGSGDATTKQHRTNDGGDFSEIAPNHMKYQEFLQSLKDCYYGKSLPFTLIITDPLANSFVGRRPHEARTHIGSDDLVCSSSIPLLDPGIQIEEFQRSYEQNESLGLNDLRTDGYSQPTKDENA